MHDVMNAMRGTETGGVGGGGHAPVLGARAAKALARRGVSNTANGGGEGQVWLISAGIEQDMDW